MPSDYRFFDLHVAIQDAMGWMDVHLHLFELYEEGFELDGLPAALGIPDPRGILGPGCQSKLEILYN